MMKKRNKLLLLCLILPLALTGCAGNLFGSSNLSEKYDSYRGNSDIEIYYNTEGKYMPSAIRNVSNTFMTNLNIAIECVKKDETLTSIHSLSNLKTYFYKELIFPVDYSSCSSVILKYIYYPQADAGFAFEDRRDYFNSSIAPSIPVEDEIVLK